MPFRASKVQIATFIAFLFHICGLIAILGFRSASFIRLTPLNLFVCFLLLLWTHGSINRAFITFFLVAFVIGFGAEWIGVHTGWLFGNYKYGAVLGFKWQNVPLLIGLNWFVTIYCAGVSVSLLQSKILKTKAIETSAGKAIMSLSLILDGALLALFFDWIIEPVAMRLGYWTWANDAVPSLNYWTWFVLSALLLIFFKLMSFPKQNLFAVHLLLIQIMFFLLLNFRH